MRLPVPDDFLALIQRLIHFLELLNNLLFHFDIFVDWLGLRGQEVQLELRADVQNTALLLRRISTALVVGHLLLDELIQSVVHADLRALV